MYNEEGGGGDETASSVAASAVVRVHPNVSPLFTPPCPVAFGAGAAHQRRVSPPPASVQSGFTDVFKLNVRRACLNQAVDLAD